MTAPTVRRVVGSDHDGERIDVYLASWVEIDSRAEAQRLIDSDGVTVNGATPRKRDAVHADDRVEVVLSPRPPMTLTPEDVPFRVCFEDAFLIVVDKPPGVVTHPSRGHESGTLVHGLLARGIGGGDEISRPGIVHRLDRDTSGLLVVAKTDRAHRRLQESLRERTIARRYRVLVHGAFPPALAVNRPIGRDARNRVRMSVNTDRPREARTIFHRLRQFPAHSLLEARLDTGRTHQIRVHLESARFPVVGDPVYGRPGGHEGLTRQFLHAAYLAFPHPETGEHIELTSELPADLQTVLDRLEHQVDPAR